MNPMTGKPAFGPSPLVAVLPMADAMESVDCSSVIYGYDISCGGLTLSTDILAGEVFAGPEYIAVLGRCGDREIGVAVGRPKQTAEEMMR